jgi:D-serine deaminase-like pyridoxal phosphate-dependent protein
VTDLAELETPFLTIDLDGVERNIARAQDYCDRHGLAFRPHVKTHKQPRIARMQLDAGAVGITCQKLGEAEVMADAGIADILVTFPVLGDAKIERLAALAGRSRMSVAADSPAAVAAAGEAGRRAGAPIGFLVECDTGGGRLGVQTPEAAAELAAEVARTEGVELLGLMTYPTSEQTHSFMDAARELLERGGFTVRVVSGGGTPTLYRTHELGGVTEVRAGEYALGDRSHAATGVVPLEDVAARVEATVVGRPTPDRAILDAGSKTLSSDRSAAGLQGHGLVLQYRDATVYELSEEHAHLDVSRCANGPKIGERVTVLPNHVCAAVNLHNEVALHHSGRDVEVVPVPARGLVR